VRVSIALLLYRPSPMLIIVVIVALQLMKGMAVRSEGARKSRLLRRFAAD
jgi:hypothetical protein